MQYNYDFKEYCFITHNTQISQMFVKSAKLQQIANNIARTK